MFVLSMGMGCAGAGLLGKLCGLLCFVPEAERNLLMGAALVVVLVPLIFVCCIIELEIRLSTAHDSSRSRPQLDSPITS